MSDWKQIKIPDDPDWQEYHKEIMHEELGRSTLKVWGYYGDNSFRKIIQNKQGARSVYGDIEAKTIEEAMQIVDNQPQQNR